VLVSWCVRHKTDTTGPSIKILIYCWSPQNCETIKKLIKQIILTKLVAPSPLPTVLPPFRYILKWPTNMYSSIYSWPHLIHNSQVVWLIKVFKKKLGICFVPTTSTSWGSMKANGREPKSCLGQVFNFKLSCSIAAKNHTQPFLELKTWPRFSPVNWSFCSWLALQCEIFWWPLTVPTRSNNTAGNSAINQSILIWCPCLALPYQTGQSAWFLFIGNPLN